MPRAPYHNQHDGQKPPYVDFWRSGGAPDDRRLALKLAGAFEVSPSRRVNKIKYLRRNCSAASVGVSADCPLDDPERLIHAAYWLALHGPGIESIHKVRQLCSLTAKELTGVYANAGLLMCVMPEVMGGDPCANYQKSFTRYWLATLHLNLRRFSIAIRAKPASAMPTAAQSTKS